jgi:hypothetical protein
VLQDILPFSHCATKKERMFIALFVLLVKVFYELFQLVKSTVGELIYVCATLVDNVVCEKEYSHSMRCQILRDMSLSPAMR